MSCPFCSTTGKTIVASHGLAIAFEDAFPVSPGHTLVVPSRHVPTWFDATAEEQHDLLRVVALAKERLDRLRKPDGYNLGINVGEAAGQTVMHLHLHVIPRYRGDVDDPRGGVRFVVPDKGNYQRPGHIPRRQSNRPRLSLGGSGDPFVAHLGPLFARAAEIDILAAFVKFSGVDMMRLRFRSALERGAQIRIITGDYLHLTQARALQALLDVERSASLGDEESSELPGTLRVRVVETDKLQTRSRSFHPKSWIFGGPGLGEAFVGSSNLSRAALEDGIEWNLRLERGEDPAGFERIREGFERWWQRAVELDEVWLADYQQRAARSFGDLPGWEVDPTEEAPPAPRDVQLEALKALAADRQAGRDRGLVVMATGLGKTWLTAFDIQQVCDAEGRMPRVLLLAHRVELLRQASVTFRRLFPDVGFAWFVGSSSRLDAQIVFASVMKLGRPANLGKLPRDAFDYIVVDEVHHAHAKTYRRILAHFEARFLLGLTATPERADAGDVLGLFDDHVAYQADIGVGVRLGHLVPFAYFGIKDTVDYAPIPWRNHRFDPGTLEAAVQTEARMQSMWRAWGEHPGTRSLVFCCSIPHAGFVAGWLQNRGVRAVAVHSGPGSADRAEALDRLTAGALDAVLAVDLFNEGIDLPAVDRVIMLRPTESPVIFLQQLGRGLRASEGKEKLTVVDFVGNHKVFLNRIRTLLQLGQQTPTSVHDFVVKRVRPELPKGCSVEVELEALDLLKKLLPSGDRHALVRAFREILASRGERPTAGEMLRLGFNPRSLKQWDTWFDFLRSEDALGELERQALEAQRDFLLELERRESMTRSFKMVTLKVLLDEDALIAGMDIERLAALCYRRMRRSPELLADLTAKELGDPLTVTPERWLRYWRTWPLAHWAGQGRQSSKKAWFRIRDAAFVPRFDVSKALRPAFVAMVEEIVDYRLADYRRRRAPPTSDGAVGFVAKLITNQRHPIIKLPGRVRHPSVPQGETDVRLEDGAWWRFRFAKKFCNVARPVGKQRNQLPDLLRRWFGPQAGEPGTFHQVRFAPSPDGWWVEPVLEGGVPLPRRGRLLAFPTLRAAAGWTADSVRQETLDPEEVALPVEVDREACFALRATGTSMEGWRSEIRDGDWLVLRWSRGAGAAAVEGRVALIARGDPAEGRSFYLKRVVRGSEGRYLLRSDNPDVPPMPTEALDDVVASLVQVVKPERLGPACGALLQAAEICQAFGVSRAPEAPWSRVDGHLFVLVEGAGTLSAPDRVALTVPRRPGETAFVLARQGPQDPWSYLGVGRWLDAEDAWGIVGVDFATWRRLGKGRSASRRLEEAWRGKAEARVAELLAEKDGTMLGSERRCRIVGRAKQGGVRIDGGPGGFSERTVSLLDLGWVLQAQDRAGVGVRVDEAFVNHLRYLDGTPKASTRWIDTGWALVLCGV